MSLHEAHKIISILALISLSSCSPNYESARSDQDYEAIVGNWVPDEAAAIKSMMERSKKALAKGTIGEDEVARWAKQAASTSLLEIGSDRSVAMHSLDESKPGSLRILESRPSLGEIDADLIFDDGTTRETTLTINGDRLTIRARKDDADPSENPTLVFDRTNSGEAEKRLEFIESANQRR